MNTKLRQRRQFIKLASGLMVTPFASLAGGAAFAQGGKPPLRMLTIIDSYGLPVATRNDTWVNTANGDYRLTVENLGSILSPLQAYKDNMLVVSGIDMDSLTLTSDTRQHDHMTTHTLCGSRRNVGTSGSTAKINHASLDVRVGQYLNNEYGLGRAFPHLFFTDYSEPAKTTFCYDELGNQIRSIPGARSQASRIFADDTSIADLQFQNSTKQDVFSLVQKQVQELRGQLSNANATTILDAYHSSVDDLATQIQLSTNNVCEALGDVSTFPGSIKGEFTNNSPFIFRNIQQAFACDLTSSLTYAIGGETINQLSHEDLYSAAEHSDTEVRDLLRRNMHAISHIVNDAANKSHEIIRISQAEHIANLLDNMSVMIDTDGNTVLDNTVIFWTSAMANNTHQKNNYPYLLIAGKNTKLNGGFHYDCSGSTNNDLLTTIAQGLSLPDESFGGHNKEGVYLSNLNNGPISRMLAG